jgi:hypothetical protein
MFKKILAAVLGVGLAITVGPAPARATFYDYVIVENHTYGTAWPVWQAVATVDQYTGSKMVNGVCTVNYRCIRIYEQRFEPSTYLAWTDPKWYFPTPSGMTGGPWIGQIKVQYDLRNYDYTFKLKILVHELGHAHYLPDAYDGTIMNRYFQGITCICFSPQFAAALATR